MSPSPSSPFGASAQAGDASAAPGAELTDDAADAAMARYAAGDPAAFAQVFALLSPRLRRFLRRLTGSKAFAEDLLQETWLKLHQSRGSFAIGMPVAPWAYTIARHCYLDAMRSAKRRPAAHDPDDGVTLRDRAAPPDTDAEQHAVARETAEAVDRALRAMTVARREAFILVRYEGLSIAAAAEVLGTTEGAVKLRAFHAYQLIREELDRLEPKPR